MHQALYRKWRPMVFDDVCGQEHITNILRYEVANGKTTHAYLFCGSRGTGKTTCAKIMAKAVNCEHPVSGSPCGKCYACKSIDAGAATDVLEMDAASNTGVDYIRDIRDEVVYTPSALKNRVYIIDEVHMLSISAFNALLKTLEEPPEQVVFILATTEPQKIPATILSRCQRFEFRRINSAVIASRLSYIAEHENISLENDAARLIARLAQGGMRDAVSMLELCSGESGVAVTAKLVYDVVGVIGRDSVKAVTKAIIEKDYERIFSAVNYLYSASKDISVFWQDLINYYRDILVVKTAKNPDKYLDLTQAELNDLRIFANVIKFETLLYHIKLMDEAFISMQKNNSSRRCIAEMTLIRMCDERLDTSYEALLARIEKLENALSISAVKNAGAQTEDAGVPEAASEIFTESAVSPPKAPIGFDWAEAVKRFEQYDKGLSPVLKPVNAVLTADELTLTVSNKFTLDMLSKENVVNQLVTIVNSLANTDFDANNIKFELGTVSAPQKDESLIDEIN